MSDAKTKVFLSAVFAAVAAVKVLIKDGLQLSDLGALMDKYNTDAAFKQKMLDGWVAAGQVVNEAKSYSFFDLLDLVQYMRSEIAKL